MKTFLSQFTFELGHSAMVKYRRIKTTKFTHIKIAERREIAFLLEKGYSLKNIADMLKRSPNTISNEVGTNAVRGTYDPEKASHKAHVRRKYSKYQEMKVIASSLTIDNDVCFGHHKQMSDIIGAPIFFCHPYHSWEKGGVENANGLIRQYIKKGTDISMVPDDFVKEVERKLQTRPRKCLRYKTPMEIMTENKQFKYLKGFTLLKKQKTLRPSVLIES